MQKRQLITIPAKIVFLTLSLFVIFVVSSKVTGMTSLSPPNATTETARAESASANAANSRPESNEAFNDPHETPQKDSTGAAAPTIPTQQIQAALGLLLACFVQVSVLAYIITGARWDGLLLAFAVFMVFFGITSLMTHVETAVFLPSTITGGALPRMVVTSLFRAAIFAPLAVVVLGRFGSARTPPRSTPRPTVKKRGLMIELLAVIAVYLVLYFTFGYFIIWNDSAARAFYGGGNVDVQRAVSFTGLVRAFVGQPRIVLLQSVRALMWFAIAWPVVRMMTGGTIRAVLAVALLFGVLFPSQLLVPNPWMPDHIRWLHLLETSTSTFLFGLFVAWRLARLLRSSGNPRSAQ